MQYSEDIIDACINVEIAISEHMGQLDPKNLLEFGKQILSENHANVIELKTLLNKCQ